jgi:hypothetical protein
MKTELEEAAEKSAIEEMEAGNSAYILGFINSAKWQQEQNKKLYSEEDMKSAFFNGGDMRDIEEFNYWFKQYKKK